MKRSYSHISLDEREKIERWRAAGVAVDVISERLGRHRSTIFCELNRNRFADTEMPELVILPPFGRTLRLLQIGL